MSYSGSRSGEPPEQDLEMPAHPSTKDLLARLSSDTIKCGEIKKIAREIERDHDLAMELWESGEFHPRMLAVLILDKKLLDQDFLNRLAADLEGGDADEWPQIADWLMAN